MKVEYDEVHGLVYFSFAPGPIMETVAIDATRRYDLDAAGVLVGVELELPANKRAVNMVGVPRAPEIGIWIMRTTGRRVRGLYYDEAVGNPITQL